MPRTNVKKKLKPGPIPSTEPTQKKMISIRMAPWLIEYTASIGVNRSQLIEDALVEYCDIK